MNKTILSTFILAACCFQTFPQDIINAYKAMDHLGQDMATYFTPDQTHYYFPTPGLAPISGVPYRFSPRLKDSGDRDARAFNRD